MASQMGAQPAPLLRRPVHSEPVLEHEWVTAITERDITTLDHILAESFIITTPFGVFTKRWCLEHLKSDELHLESISHDGETVLHSYGDESVVHGTVTVKGVYRGRDISGQYWYRYTGAKSKWLGYWQATNCQALPFSQLPPFCNGNH